MKKYQHLLLSSVGLLYPIILLFFFLKMDSYNIKVLLVYAVFAIVLYAVSCLFSKRISKVLFVILSFFYSIVLLTDCLLAHLFGNTITQNMLFTVYETNPEESREFMHTYLSWTILLIVLSLLFFTLMGVFFFLKTTHKSNLKFKMFYSILILVGILGLTKASCYAKPLVYVQSYFEYKNYISELDKTYSKKEGGQFTQVTCKRDTLTAVVIVGESVTRRHMSLYGYPRETNPLLSKQRNLLVFNHVKSPHCTTIASLCEVLTFADKDAPYRTLQGSLMQLCNRAGFTSYWISNQAALGIQDNAITMLSKSCANSFFTPRLPLDSCKTPYDEAIFNVFDSTLNAKTPKKIIFVHLFGSHYCYNKRYPNSYNHFTDPFPKTYFSVNEKEKIQTINEYDNSILYNDWIVHSIIQKVQKKKSTSCVIYFSDHGEDTYETNKNFCGHSDDIASLPMHQIPFIVWTSSHFKLPHDAIDVTKSYCTDDLMFSIADLLQINFDEMEKGRSIFR